MNHDNENKGMRQAKGGVFAQEDIELLKQTIEYYLKNNKSLSSQEEAKVSLLFHRLGRMGFK
jgi:hypothetical protein|tara:strand:- start:237 stop:422 length:186 start_codon:yes stop_codon:yes gene_type:complete